MLFRDISFDMIMFTLTEILHVHLQQIRTLLFFFLLLTSFLHICHNCESLSQNLELAILNHTEYIKLPLIPLVIVNNSGNKIFNVKYTNQTYIQVNVGNMHFHPHLSFRLEL